MLQRTHSSISVVVLHSVTENITVHVSLLFRIHVPLTGLSLILNGTSRRVEVSLQLVVANGHRIVRSHTLDGLSV